MNLSGITSSLLKADLSLAEKGIAAAKVILTGFVVVFAVLILLILIIKLYSAIVSKATQGGKKKKKKELVAETEKPFAEAASAAKSAPGPAVQSGLSDEIVAVISAAVATTYGSPEKARIKSIKKADGGRSAWANAGLLDNTRPF